MHYLVQTRLKLDSVTIFRNSRPSKVFQVLANKFG